MPDAGWNIYSGSDMTGKVNGMTTEVTKDSKDAVKLVGPKTRNAGLTQILYCNVACAAGVCAAASHLEHTHIYLPRTVASRAIRMYMPFSAWRK